MAQFYPNGLLGLGLTALMASFMSGMAGNVTAFNTVFTYDIHQSYIVKRAPDRHYLWVGRVTTIAGVILSIGAAFLATHFNDLMDFLQLIFAFVNAPLFATFLLGMFWKRTTGHGAFCGLLLGLIAGGLTLGLTVAEHKGGWIAPLYHFPPSMAQDFWIAIWSWVACFVITIAVSSFTRPRAVRELHGLVYGVAPIPHPKSAVWYQRPVPLAVIVGAVLIVRNALFW